MKLVAVIEAGLIGTTIMTLFSYVVAAQKKENFKEPELLNALIDRLPNYAAKPHPITGWLLHYTLGSVWAIVYSTSLEVLEKKPTNKRAVLFGIFGGAVGVYTWKALFKQHPQPPQLAYTSFYRQLFIVHILFALSMSKALPKQ